MSSDAPSPSSYAQQGDADDIIAWEAGPLWRLIQRWNTSLYHQSCNQVSSDLMRFMFGNLWTKSRRYALDPYINKRELLKRSKIDVKPPGTDLNDFQYTSLSSDSQIRLVHIHAGAPNAPLTISFSIVELSEAPHFETLSYVWGEKRHHRVTCDGASLVVRANLFNALHTLRSTEETRLFWIDALCINQADPTERARQVSFMRDIYAKSQRTMIWLGKANPLTTEGVALLGTLADVSQGMVDIGSLSSDDTVFANLGILYANPWFYRVWIIQEVAVARNVFVVLREDDIWPWDRFAQASYVALNHCKIWQMVLDPNSVTWLDRIRQQYLTDGPRPKLLQALVYAKTALATLEVDKIYATLGLTTESFHVDYEESSTATYTRLAAHVVTTPGGLDLLSFVDDHCFRLNTNLPSWIPDWEIRHGPQPYYAANEYLTWNASFGAEPFVRLSADNRCLHVHGVIVDEVRYVGICFLEEPPVTGGIRKVAHNSLKKQFLQFRQPYAQLTALRRAQQWRELALKHATMYQTIEERHDAYLSTLVAGQVPMDEQSLALVRRGYSLWCKVWLDAALNDLRTAHSAYNTLSSDDLSCAIGFMQTHVHAAWGRRLFTSQRRGAIGLCPSMARRGDLLVLIHGSNMPCILRRVRNGKYRFVGQCYAHGLMYGEAKDWEDLPARQEIQLV